MKLTSKRKFEQRKSNWIHSINKFINHYVTNNCFGTIDLDNTPIKKLPNQLTHVRGNLYMSRTNITELPTTLKKVDRTLTLSHTPISLLPDNLYIGGDLLLYDCKHLTHLPKGLFVYGTLDIDGSSIEKLPDDLVVINDMWCFHTPLDNRYTQKQMKNTTKIFGFIHCSIRCD